jgi:serine protease Do
MSASAYKRPYTYIALLFSFVLLSPTAESATLQELNAEITSLLGRVRSSVVTIYAYRQSPRSESSAPFASESVDTQIGTGFVYDNTGHVITTSHVVQGGSRYDVIANDGRRLKARLIGADKEADISVLAISPGQFPPIPLNTSSVILTGSLLFVLGNSFGIANAAALGTAVGLRPDGTLQVSANLAPGYSGGPVVDVSGSLVGVVTAKLTEPVLLSPLRLTRTSSSGTKVWTFSGAETEIPSAGVILALSSRELRKAADRIITGERSGKGYLGILPQDMDPEWMEQTFKVKHGVMVAEVLANSPAWKAGVRTGDILTTYLGRRIYGSDQLRKLIAESREGDVVNLVVVRGNRNLTFTVQLVSAREMGSADGSGSSNAQSDTIAARLETEIPPDDYDKREIEEEILQVRRELQKQLDILDRLHRRLDRMPSDKP